MAEAEKQRRVGGQLEEALLTLRGGDVAVGGEDPERHLRQLVAHGWAYRRLLRRGVVALWVLAAVELARLLLELVR
jgi:hypothetical protein